MVFLKLTPVEEEGNIVKDKPSFLTAGDLQETIVHNNNEASKIFFTKKFKQYTKKSVKDNGRFFTKISFTHQKLTLIF